MGWFAHTVTCSFTMWIAIALMMFVVHRISFEGGSRKRCDFARELNELAQSSIARSHERARIETYVGRLAAHM